MTWLLDKLVDWWMSRCRHHGDDVAADLLEGGGADEVSWCRRCGSVSLNHGEFRRPRPLWAEPYNTAQMLADAKRDEQAAE